ncbi:MAG: DUF192 domain-containing protein [Phycisphaerales bacterium]|jgi:hypothetical protein|nr:DUF192 domain-containing protein [Phycisphaerales bacterium]
MASTRLILAAWVLICLAACEHQGPRTEQVRIGARDWLLEVAAGPEATQRGLMDRSTIPDGTGMLFIFERPTMHRFWMANCSVDIDLIFIDGQGRVAAMHRMKTEPPQGATESLTAYHERLPLYSSRIPVQYAIELPAGAIDELGIRAGDRLALDLQRLKSMAR